MPITASADASGSWRRSSSTGSRDARPHALIAFNGIDSPIDRFCSDEMCGALPASTGTVVIGDHLMVPKPSFIYVPKRVAAAMQMSLIVESSDTIRPEERSYTEFPVVRESDFMRMYALRSTSPAYEHDYWLLPQEGANSAGLDAAPTFNMECDLSAYVNNYGAPVRVELEPLTPGAKIWGLVSITNNVTQHFYTLVPR